jgi:hypothetical protein
MKFIFSQHFLSNFSEEFNHCLAVCHNEAQLVICGLIYKFLVIILRLIGSFMLHILFYNVTN